LGALRRSDTFFAFVLRAVRRVLADHSLTDRQVITSLWSIFDDPDLNGAPGHPSEIAHGDRASKVKTSPLTSEADTVRIPLHHIELKDGTTLVTLADVILPAGAYPYSRASVLWQRAAELMIQAAEDGATIEAATKQVELALFLEARYLPVLGRRRSRSE
jgi:hypothetical protein